MKNIIFIVKCRNPACFQGGSVQYCLHEGFLREGGICIFFQECIIRNAFGLHFTKSVKRWGVFCSTVGICFDLWVIVDATKYHLIRKLCALKTFREVLVDMLVCLKW